MVPSPKLKMTLAIGVWSVSVDPLASAITVNGAGPELTDRVRTPTGATSGTGVGVLVGALVGLVGTLGGRAITDFADGRADGVALDAACGGADGAGAVGSGVVVTACACADGVAAGRGGATRWARSIRVNTKKGKAIATMRTVAPIEKSGKRVRSKPPYMGHRRYRLLARHDTCLSPAPAGESGACGAR
jgi:hypothetical protein